MQAESNVFVMETGQCRWGGGGKEGEGPPAHVRDVASSERTTHDQQRKQRFLPQSPSSPPPQGKARTPQTEASWCLPFLPLHPHTPMWSSPALFTLALVGKC